MKNRDKAFDFVWFFNKYLKKLFYFILEEDKYNLLTQKDRKNLVDIYYHTKSEKFNKNNSLIKVMYLDDFFETIAISFVYILIDNLSKVNSHEYIIIIKDIASEKDIKRYKKYIKRKAIYNKLIKFLKK